jgi:hypothetical protein
LRTKEDLHTLIVQILWSRSHDDDKLQLTDLKSFFVVQLSKSSRACELAINIPSIFELESGRFWAHFPMSDTGRALNEIIQVLYDGRPFDGIFAWFCKEHHKNAIDAGFVNLLSADQSDPFMKKSLILEPNISGAYYNYSGGFPTAKDNWLEFDFGTRRIGVTAYTIRCCDRYIMKRWDILGSDDHVNWSMIHAVKSDELVQAKDRTSVFLCDRRHQPFRFVRYIQHENWERDDRLKFFVQIAAIELFGILFL